MSLNLQLEKTKTGYQTLKVLHEGKEYYLHSKYNPEKEAATWAQSFYEQDKLFVLIGLGLGYYAKALTAMLDEDDKLLVIEPCHDIYELVQKNIDLQELFNDPRVAVCVGSATVDYQSIIGSLIGQQSFSENKIFVCPNYDKLFPLQELFDNIRTAFMFYIMNLNTVRLFAKDWQENYLKNLKYAVHSLPFAEFTNEFSVPAVIVSAGPSLTAELPKLKELSTRAIIISAGSATPVLQKNNITPHIIVSVDGGIPNYNHFKEVNYSDVPLFYAPTIHYKILEEYHGPKVIFQFNSEEINEWYNKILEFNTGTVQMGPSVANCALDIACKITSGPICLVGQDLGFTGGVSHAEGNIHRKNISDNKESLIRIEANDGSELMSDYPFISMRDWFQNYLNLHKKEVYNATLKGAKITGTVVIEFQEFINRFCDTELNIKQEISKKFDDIGNHGDNSEKLNKISNQILTCLDEMCDISFEGKKLSQKLIKSVNRNDAKKIAHILSKLSEIDDKLKSLEDKESILHFIIRPILIKLSFWTIDEHKEVEKKNKEIAEQNYFLYNELNQVSLKVKRMLVDYI